MTAGTAADLTTPKEWSVRYYGAWREQSREDQVRCHGLVLVKTQGSREQLETGP